MATWAQSDSQTKPTWVHTYTWLTAAVLLVGLSRAVLCFHCCLEAAKRMHGVMTARVLRAPLDFFHANPTGRVLNRFSKDLGVADEQLPNILFDTLQCGGEVLGTVVSHPHLHTTRRVPCTASSPALHLTAPRSSHLSHKTRVVGSSTSPVQFVRSMRAPAETKPESERYVCGLCMCVWGGGWVSRSSRRWRYPW